MWNHAGKLTAIVILPATENDRFAPPDSGEEDVSFWVARRRFWILIYFHSIRGTVRKAVPQASVSYREDLAIRGPFGFGSTDTPSGPVGGQPSKPKGAYNSPHASKTEQKVKEFEMTVTGEIAELRSLVSTARQRGCRIGCVPTMGALHAGHLSLVEECRKHVDFVVTTIFVNPSQFAAGEDLEKYPRPVEADLQACAGAGVDIVYMPEIPSLYPPGYETWVSVDRLSTILEGAIRPTHFKGVTTIVLKLFNLVQPDVACFGAKDYQQQALIRRMVRDLNVPIEIIVCPTVRDPDGLAMSSRNVYLTPEERESALALSQALALAEERLRGGTREIATVERSMLDHMASFAGVTPQYAVLRDPDTLAELTLPQSAMVALVAAKVGETRLIDNRTILL